MNSSTHLKQLEMVFRQLRQINPELRAQTALLFLMIAQSTSALSVAKVAATLGVAQSSASRNIDYLRKYGLAETWVDRTDLRKRLVGLTTKGQDLADLISHTLNPTKGGSNGNDNQLKRTRL